MNEFTRNKGAVDQRYLVYLRHATTGMGLTGLAFDTAGLACYYHRPGAAGETQITLAEHTTPAPDDPHLDGGFLEVDATNFRGWYIFDAPDAVQASGADQAALVFKGAANLLDTPVNIELLDVIDASNPIVATVPGLVVASGTIGATGNDTTHLHLAGLTYGDDEINNHLIVIEDVSAGEFHARWVTDWADTGDLATVGTLPFTPEASVDRYWLLPMRQDVSTGLGTALLDKLAAALHTNITVTMDAGASATVIPIKAISPSISTANQFSKRVMMFRDDTPTVALRGQITDIVSHTSSGGLGTLTCGAQRALTTAPAEDDVAVIL